MNSSVFEQLDIVQEVRYSCLFRLTRYEQTNEREESRRLFMNFEEEERKIYLIHTKTHTHMFVLIEITCEYKKQNNNKSTLVAQEKKMDDTNRSKCV